MTHRTRAAAQVTCPDCFEDCPLCPGCECCCECWECAEMTDTTRIRVMRGTVDVVPRGKYL